MTRIKQFIKENLVLFIGLTLPVFLIIIFFLATVLPKSLTDPPQYPSLYTYTSYQRTADNINIDYVVKEGQLKAHIKKVDPKNTGANKQKLMLYDPRHDNLREIAIDLSKFKNAADGDEVVIDELKDAKIDSSIKAPDGYYFESNRYRNGGPMMWFFGGFRHDYELRLKKNSVSYKIPQSDAQNYYSQFHFIGWIINKNNS